MNTIDTEHNRLQTYYQTYLQTITQSDVSVSYLFGKFLVFSIEDL